MLSRFIKTSVSEVGGQVISLLQGWRKYRWYAKSFYKNKCFRGWRAGDFFVAGAEEIQVVRQAVL